MKASSRIDIIPEVLADVEAEQNTSGMKSRLVNVGKSVGKTLVKGLIFGVGVGIGMYPFASSWVEGFGEEIAPVSGGLNQVSEKTDDLRETVEVEANELRGEDGGIRVVVDGVSAPTTQQESQVVPESQTSTTTSTILP